MYYVAARPNGRVVVVMAVMVMAVDSSRIESRKKQALDDQLRLAPYYWIRVSMMSDAFIIEDVKGQEYEILGTE